MSEPGDPAPDPPVLDDPNLSTAGPSGKDRLHRVLSEIQRRGGIGRVTIDDAIAHAELFVTALPDEVDRGRLVDLGSGGGLPGLVIVASRPDLEVTLVERRDKRADLLRFGVRGLDATGRVRVISGDVHAVVRREAGEFDVVTARSFGPVAEVLRIGEMLLRPGGCLIVSDPPPGSDRLPDADVTAMMVDDGRVDGPAGTVHRWRRSSTIT